MYRIGLSASIDSSRLRATNCKSLMNKFQQTSVKFKKIDSIRNNNPDVG